MVVLALPVADADDPRSVEDVQYAGLIREIDLSREVVEAKVDAVKESVDQLRGTYERRHDDLADRVGNLEVNSLPRTEFASWQARAETSHRLAISSLVASLIAVAGIIAAILATVLHG